jgi:hypothetical protein
MNLATAHPQNQSLELGGLDDLLAMYIETPIFRYFPPSTSSEMS